MGSFIWMAWDWSSMKGVDTRRNLWLRLFFLLRRLSETLIMFLAEFLLFNPLWSRYTCIVAFPERINKRLPFSFNKRLQRKILKSSESSDLRTFKSPIIRTYFYFNFAIQESPMKKGAWYALVQPMELLEHLLQLIYYIH